MAGASSLTLDAVRAMNPLPWECGDARTVYGLGTRQPTWPTWLRSTSAIFIEAKGSADLQSPEVQKRKTTVGGNADEDEQRKAMLAEWRAIALGIGSEGSKVALDLEELGVDEGIELMANVMASKATSTLKVRASSIKLYLRWHSTSGAEYPTLPPKEETVYAYVEDMRKTGAPATRAQRFMESLMFMKGVLAMNVQAAALSSSRIKGSVIRS